MRRNKTRSKARKELLKDIFFVILGAVMAALLAHYGAIDVLIKFFGGSAVSSFIAGIFFTSIFTIAPASVALFHISQTTPFATVALWGALGALCGDLILFFFIRDRFVDDLLKSLKPTFVKHILASFHLGFMKWLSPLIGALIIASPLPDEFGLALMGMSRLRVAILVPVSFLMNALGIYAVIWFGGLL